MSNALEFQSFTIQAGQDVNLNFTVTDRAGATRDISGTSIRFALSRKAWSNPLLDSSEGTATVTITSGVQGRFTVALSDTNTDNLIGDYYYEVKITDGAGNETIAARGLVSFEPSITGG